MGTKLKPVLISDQEAIQRIHCRAKAEGRSLANAAARTVIEALPSPNDPNNTNQDRFEQVEKNTKFVQREQNEKTG